VKSLKALLVEFRSGRGLKGQLLRGGFWSLVIKLLSTLMALLTAVVLARALGAEGFGIYSFIFAVVSILAIPAQMGLPNLVVRETARAHVSEQWDVMKGLWRWSSLTALGMSIALMVVGGTAAWLFAPQLGPLQSQTLWWGLLLVPLVALGNLRGAALRGLRRVVQGQLPEFVLRPALLISAVLLLVLVSGAPLAPDRIMAFHVGASVIAFFIGAILLWRARPSGLAAECHMQINASAWLKSTIPLALISGMDVIGQNISVIVLGMFGSHDDAAFFRVAVQCALVAGFLSTIAKLLTAPYISQLHALGDRSRMQRLVAISARITFSFSLLASIVFLVAGGPLIYLLFGAEFRASTVPLYILLLAQLTGAFGSLSITLLNMTGHERDTAKATAIAVLINCACALVLCPFFGATGAALATFASVAVWQPFLWHRVHQRLGINVTAFVGAGAALKAISSRRSR
jgi:O-antigen/teichoic acid export membrane protein